MSLEFSDYKNIEHEIEEYLRTRERAFLVELIIHKDVEGILSEVHTYEIVYNTINDNTKNIEKSIRKKIYSRYNSLFYKNISSIEILNIKTPII